MAKEKNSNINTFEMIIIVIVGIAISYVFYLELNALSNRLSKIENQINGIQTDIVNLRLQIKRNAVPNPVTPSNNEENPSSNTTNN